MEASPTVSISSKQLLKRAEKRLERFAARFAEITDHDDPEAIHDTRVRSRRLQQLFNTIFAKPRTKKQRKLIRLLRRVRRRLGSARSMDVSLEIVAQILDEAADPSSREAWEQFRSYLQAERQKAIQRARKKLSAYKIADFVDLSHRHLNRARAELDSRDNHAALENAVQQARQQWVESLALARETQTADRLHALRIAAKRLRYRAELLAEFGDGYAKSLVKDLKNLQQALGRWHDRHVLFQSVAEFAGRADFLMSHPEIVRCLLNEIEKERNEENAMVKKIIESADKI
jgi:CHAD domain-containing protein